MTPPSIALIHTQYGPYHLARGQALRQHYPGPVDLIQLASHEALRQWDTPDALPLTTLASGTLETLPSQHLSNKLKTYLEATRPDVVVIAGYGYPAMRAAATWCRRVGTTSILLSDSQSVDTPRHWLKEALKKRWLRQHFQGAFVAGASAAFYLMSLGFAPDCIWRGYDVVDNDHFADRVQTIRSGTSGPSGLPDLPAAYFLYVGRLSPEKNLQRLLKAYQQYRDRLGPEAWGLVLVGDGPDRPALEQWVHQQQLPEVVFTGFQQVNQLPAYYAFAQALILPSLSEPWGLVINEAMAASLPILASTRCGAIWDLVFPGQNGFLFDPLQPAQMTDRMVQFTQLSPDTRARMGQASRQRIAQYTPETWAIALTDCIQHLQPR